MVGPDFSEPTTGLEAEWSSSYPSISPGSKGGGVNIKWWTQFNDPELNRLVEAAYHQNLTLRTAALRILESRALLGIAQGNMFPQSQALSGDLVRLHNSGSGPDPYLNSSSFGFDAAWELDFWGKFRRAIESSEANVMTDMADYDDILVSLSAEVATTYVNIRTLEERIRLAHKNTELQTDSLALVELQFEAGTVTELDVLQAKTLLTNTQAQIPAMQTSLRKFHNALATLLGHAPNAQDRRLLGKGSGIPQAPATIGVGVPAELLRRRPDIRRAEMIAISQGAQIGVARSDLFPSFTLLGSLGTSANDLDPNKLSDMFRGDNLGFTFGPTFRWNILNYGRIKNNVRAHDARFEQTITGYQNTVLNAAREVEDGMTSFVNSKQEAEFLRQSVETSRKSTELSMLQYEEGLADYQRVLDSIRSLTQKQDQYASTQGAIATNLIATYKALGGGWEMHHHNREESIPDDVRSKMQQRTNWGKMLDLSEPPPTAQEETPK